MPLRQRSKPILERIGLAEWGPHVVFVLDGENHYLTPDDARAVADRFRQAADQVESDVVPRINMRGEKAA